MEQIKILDTEEVNHGVARTLDTEEVNHGVDRTLDTEEVTMEQIEPWKQKK